MKYLALLRGINVGGKNRIKMAELREHLEDLGLKNVTTYIQSGNVLFETDVSPASAAELIEKSLPKKFKLDSKLIKAHVLSDKQFKSIVENAPAGFGQEPEKYYYDFIFLKGVDAKEALENIETNPKVDDVWTGPGALYFRRLSAKRTSSRLSKITGKAIYQNMTIRNWTTVSKLLKLTES